MKGMLRWVGVETLEKKLCPLSSAPSSGAWPAPGGRVVGRAALTALCPAGPATLATGTCVCHHRPWMSCKTHNLFKRINSMKGDVEPSSRAGRGGRAGSCSGAGFHLNQICRRRFSALGSPAWYRLWA